MSAIHMLLDEMGAMQLVGRSGRVRTQLDANGLPMISQQLQSRFAEAVRNAISQRSSSAIRSSIDSADLECLMTIRPAREAGKALVSFIDFREPLNSLTADMLMEVFELTQAEADVGLAIHAGLETHEIAQLRGVSLETVRWQVKAILGKTNSRSQKRFIALLTRIALALPQGTSPVAPDGDVGPKS
jgi:DNA-binding NarL/FixJ family response regulator